MLKKLIASCTNAGRFFILCFSLAIIYKYNIRNLAPKKITRLSSLINPSNWYVLIKARFGGVCIISWPQNLFDSYIQEFLDPTQLVLYQSDYLDD